ncbi:MAG: amino acid permease [Balneolales bacterium]
MEKQENRLQKNLNLFHVYAISIGAMFSSGFFILPAIVSSETGPAVVLAYLLGGFLVIPSVFSLAELSTALPKAGGSYYYLDRSLGPMVGTIGGIGNWFTLLFKSAFALVGMGAYLSLFVNLNITLSAILFTVFFTIANIFGARQTGRLQVALIIFPMIIIALFLVTGLTEVFSRGGFLLQAPSSAPFLTNGMDGLAVAVGLVFLSYGGLKKVVSMSEEVSNPERNIPLGMMLSLLTTIIVFVVGVYIMVALLGPEGMSEDLTPAASAAALFPGGVSGQTIKLLIVLAAVFAFASTANAGIMSASRFPMAMARDQLIWNKLSYIGRFNTPSIAILFTGGSMIVFILVLDIENVAKLGGAFALFTFGLINLALIVMRESKIESYDPGFRTPLYPWMQIAGMLISSWLIIQMGLLPILFTVGVIVSSIIWYVYYAKERVYRDGAIYHIFERLGRRRYEELDKEMLGIMKEKGLRENDPFDQVVARARVFDMESECRFEQLLKSATSSLSERLPISADDIAERLPTSPDMLVKGFMEGSVMGATAITRGVALPHLRIYGIKHPEMVLVRYRKGLHPEVWDDWYTTHEVKQKCYALIFLVSPDENPGQHLRFLSQLASRVEEPDFMKQWLNAENEQELKELLLQDDRFFAIQLERKKASGVMIGKLIKEIEIPEKSLIAMIYRNGHVIVPTGATRLKEGDRLTFIGAGESVAQLYKRYSGYRS